MPFAPCLARKFTPLANYYENRYHLTMLQDMDRVPKLANFKKQNRILFAAILLLIALVSLLLPASAQQTITLDDYRRLIGRANSQAQTAINQPDQCSIILGNVAEALTAVTHVQLPNGTIMPVDHAGAEQILNATPCNPQAATAYLSGICPARLCPFETVQPERDQLPEISININPGDNPNLPTDNIPVDTLTDIAEQLPGSSSDLPPDSTTTLPDTISIDASDLPADNAESGASIEIGEGNPAESDGTLSDGAANGEQTGEGELPGTPSVELPQDNGESGDIPDFTTIPVAEGEEAATGEGELTVGGEGEPTTGEQQAGEQPAEGNSEAENGEGETAVSTPESEESELPAEETAEEKQTNNQNQLILISLLILAALALMLVGIFLWRRQRADEARRKKQDKPASTAAAVEEGRQQLEEENYREAVRQLFLATLLVLEERGILQFDKTLTNYELLTKMHSNPNIMTTLRSVVSTVERVWYGYEPIASNDYEELVVKIDALRYAEQ